MHLRVVLLRPMCTTAGSSGQAGQHFVALDPSTGTGFVLNNPGEAHPLRPYWEYLCFVFRKLPVLSEDARTESEYRDYLQAPLQPLQVRYSLKSCADGQHSKCHGECGAIRHTGCWLAHDLTCCAASLLL